MTSIPEDVDFLWSKPSNNPRHDKGLIQEIAHSPYTENSPDLERGESEPTVGDGGRVHERDEHKIGRFSEKEDAEVA